VPPCIFASDLHGSLPRFKKLFEFIKAKRPAAVFLGGDFVPPQMYFSKVHETTTDDFFDSVLGRGFTQLHLVMGASYPRVFIVLGNHDPRLMEKQLARGEKSGRWEYAHGRRLAFGSHDVIGYNFVPPSPFLFKDWERHDVSRYVDPGCIALEDGRFSTPVNEHELKYATIAEDLRTLTEGQDLSQVILLFHTPPYQTKLDRAELDCKMIDQVPLDVNVGSIAVKRFIEERQPLLTLHGHIHESPRLTGSWQDQIGRTVCLSAAHDGPELALISFDPDDLGRIERFLI
jgi:Icc-related predicted phosphoesterase